MEEVKSWRALQRRGAARGKSSTRELLTLSGCDLSVRIKAQVIILMVPLEARLATDSNVRPLSALILATGSSLVAFVCHQSTATFSSLTAICISCNVAFVVLLRISLSLNVAPASLDDLNTTSSLPVLL